jgi:iron complex outermembrane receptor protein
LWIQDAWKLNDVFKLTTGLRAESWHATDGYLFASGISVVPEHSNYNAVSPKLSFSWDMQNYWITTMSYGHAARFPTTSELYSVSSASTSVGTGTKSTPKIVPPTSSIKPESVDSLELSFENFGSLGDFRATFFAQDVKDALLSTLGNLDPTSPTIYYSYWQNVKKVRNFGVEFFGNKKNFLIHGLDINGSVTFVKSEILESNGQINAINKSIVGNPVPYVPPIRLTAMATYRPDSKMTYTVAARYQKAGASSLENNDTNPNTYQGFSSYFVVDAKASYKIDKNWRASFGVDNLLNRDYFIFHPFPQRTFVANLKYTY